MNPPMMNPSNALRTTFGANTMMMATPRPLAISSVNGAVSPGPQSFRNAWPNSFPFPSDQTRIVCLGRGLDFSVEGRHGLRFHICQSMRSLTRASGTGPTEWRVASPACASS